MSHIFLDYGWTAAYWTFLTSAELDELNEEFDRLPLQSAGLSTPEGTKYDDEVRSCALSWLPKDHRLSVLMGDALRRVNDAHYGYELGDGLSQLQVTNYAEPQDRYRTHLDWSVMPRARNRYRKLSMVLQMSHENAYEGGDLVIYSNMENEIVAPRHAGALIIFPSFTYHTVNPIVSGRRRSVVAWAYGHEPLR